MAYGIINRTITRLIYAKGRISGYFMNNQFGRDIKKTRFSKTWWSARWIAVLESFGWANRLQRGRTYARYGNVLNFEITKGRITAQVQGRKSKPYSVEINFDILNKQDWDKVADLMAKQAAYSVKLLNGEMPQNIEDAFVSSKINLFPGKSKDIKAKCSCPDWANPCKHIAAVYYLVAEAFDNDPFMIFLLRGCSKDEIISTLRRKRMIENTVSEGSADTRKDAIVLLQEEKPEPLRKTPQQFWKYGDSFDSIQIKISEPEVEMELIKQLGKPDFWESKHDFLKLMSRCYSKIKNKCLELAFKNEK